MTSRECGKTAGKEEEQRGKKKGGADKRGGKKEEGGKRTGSFNTNFYVIESESECVVQFTLLLVSPGFSSQASCSTSFLNVPATTT